MSNPYATRREGGQWQSYSDAEFADLQEADHNSDTWYRRAMRASVHLKRALGDDVRAHEIINQWGQDHPNWTYRQYEQFCREKAEELEK